MLTLLLEPVLPLKLNPVRKFRGNEFKTVFLLSNNFLRDETVI